MTTRAQHATRTDWSLVCARRSSSLITAPARASDAPRVASARPRHSWRLHAYEYFLSTARSTNSEPHGIPLIASYSASQSERPAHRRAAHHLLRRALANACGAERPQCRAGRLFTVENGAKYSSKKRKFDGDQNSRRLARRSPPLPDGSYYCSLVVSRKPKLLAALVQSGDLRHRALYCHVQQESALWFFVGRNSGSDALSGRPPHTDEVHKMRASTTGSSRAARSGRCGRRRSSRAAWAGVNAQVMRRRRRRLCAASVAMLCVSTRDWWHSAIAAHCR